VELARRSKPFGMRIMAIDLRPIDQELLDEIRPAFLGSPDDVDHVVAQSDYLSLHLHLTPETRHLVDKRRIELMKPTACLINVARGELVDEAALYGQHSILPAPPSEISHMRGRTSEDCSILAAWAIVVSPSNAVNHLFATAGAVDVTKESWPVTCFRVAQRFGPSSSDQGFRSGT
jgi:hypothetical protein